MKYKLNHTIGKPLFKIHKKTTRRWFWCFLVVKFPATTNPHSVLMRGQWLSLRLMRGSWRLVAITLIYAHASVFPHQPAFVIRVNTRTPKQRRSSSSLPTSLTVGVCDGVMGGDPAARKRNSAVAIRSTISCWGDRGPAVTTARLDDLVFMSNGEGSTTPAPRLRPFKAWVSKCSMSFGR